LDWKEELKDLLNVESGLSDWEMEFVESVADSTLIGRIQRRTLEVHYLNPTAKQEKKIHELWDKHCSGESTTNAEDQAEADFDSNYRDECY